MLYAIIGRDVPNSVLLRRHARPAHLERVERLRDQGRLLLAGPLPVIDSPDPGPAGFLGSLIVAEFGDLAEAREWASHDPYVTEGVFASVDVQPFVKVMP